MDLIKFFQTVGKLKEEKRCGWVDRGVKNAESVAEHSFRLSVMALTFAKKMGLDESKAVKLAVVHDLPESICGDVATRIKEELQKITNHEKKEREEKALDELCGMLDEKTASEIRALWEEYEARESKEAKLVYELDRLEAILQAVEYEEKGNFELSLEEFYEYADARLELPETRVLFEELMKKRAGKQPSSRKH